jgi:ABC-type branched-subunit amino acid transport system permease subunit
MYGGWQRVVSPIDFIWLQSLFLLLTVALGGLDTVAGAFAAALFFSLRSSLPGHLDPLLLVGLGAVSLGRNPSGVAGMISDALYGLRERWRSRVPGRVEEAELVPG